MRSLYFFLRSPLSPFGKTIALLIGFAALFSAYSDCVNRQWDFPVYYLAAHALAQGQNPYDPPTLQSIADSKEEVGYGGGLPYLYPPHLARLIEPLSRCSFFTASFLWMTGKCLALEFMVILTLFLLRTPLTPLNVLLTHIAALLYRPIGLDMNAGNIATLEAALILAGLTAWSREKYRAAGALTILGGSMKGSSLLLILYPLHIRDWRFLKPLTISALILGGFLLLDWKAMSQCFSFYESPQWKLTWDEQVQSFYNCSSTTVLLRTFTDTYFATPLWRFPTLVYIFIPTFPTVIFILMIYTLSQNMKNQVFMKTHGAILSLVICGILLIPPRLAGYTLVWTFFPMVLVIFEGWKVRAYSALILALSGLILVQLDLPPNHIPAGITQLLIDKDFFGLLFLFLSSFILCNSRKYRMSP